MNADEFLAANAKAKAEGKKPATYKPLHVYANEDEAIMAYNEHVIGPHCPIGVRVPARPSTAWTAHQGGGDHPRPHHLQPATSLRIWALWTADATPTEQCFDYEITFTCGKKQLGQIVDRTISKHGFTVAAEVLDAIKATGYKYSTLAAITVSIADMTVPPKKYELVARHREAGPGHRDASTRWAS